LESFDFHARCYCCEAVLDGNVPCMIVVLEYVIVYFSAYSTHKFFKKRSHKLKLYRKTNDLDKKEGF
jgi:hypothetical protein